MPGAASQLADCERSEPAQSAAELVGGAVQAPRVVPRLTGPAGPSEGPGRNSVCRPARGFQLLQVPPSSFSWPSGLYGFASNAGADDGACAEPSSPTSSTIKETRRGRAPETIEPFPEIAVTVDIRGCINTGIIDLKLA